MGALCPLRPKVPPCDISVVPRTVRLANGPTVHAPPAGYQGEEQEENKLSDCLEEMLNEETRRYQHEYH